MSTSEYIQLIKAFLNNVGSKGKPQHRQARYAMARYICECLWKGQPLYLAHIYTIAGRKANGYTGRRKSLWAAFNQVLNHALHMGVLESYQTYYILTSKRKIRVILRLIPPAGTREVAQVSANWYASIEEAKLALINQRR